MLQIDTADGFEPVSIQLEVTKLANVGRLSGGSSEWAFDVPVTPTNRAFFEDWQNKNSYSPNAPTLKDVLMNYAGQSAKPAKLKLISATATTYKVVLLMDNTDIFTQLRGVKVRDLGWGTSTAVDGGSAIGAPIEWGTAATPYEACNFPVKWRDWLTGADGKCVSASDCWFGVSIYWIIQKALERISPTKPALSSNLIKPANDWFFRSLVLGFNPNAGYDEAYYRDLIGLRVSHTAGLITYLNCPDVPFPPTLNVSDWQKLTGLVDDFTTPNFDTAGNYDVTTQTYTAPLTLKYRFRLVIGHNDIRKTGDPWAGLSGAYRTGMELNSSGVIDYPFLPSFGNLLIASGAYGEWLLDIDLTAGDTIQFYFTSAFDYGSTFDVRMNQCYVEVSKPQDYVSGEAADLAGLIPADVEVLDIFKALSNMFNLRWFYNSITDTVHVDPEHDWYDWEGNKIDGFVTGEIDWTQKVDSGAIEMVPCREALNETYIWDDAEDITLLDSDKPRAIKAATGVYNTGRNDAEPATTKVEFPKLNHILDSQVQADDGAGDVLTLGQLPIFYPVNHNSDPQTTELFTKRVSFIGCVLVTDNADPNGGVLNAPDGLGYSFLQCGHFDHSGTAVYGNYTAWPSLEFGDAVNVQGTTTIGLVKRFWLQTLSSLRQGKRLKAKFTPSALDLSTIDFRKFVRVGSILYVVEEVTIKKDDGSVTLRQYIPSDGDDELCSDSDVKTLLIYAP